MADAATSVQQFKKKRVEEEPDSYTIVLFVIVFLYTVHFCHLQVTLTFVCIHPLYQTIVYIVFFKFTILQ